MKRRTLTVITAVIAAFAAFADPPTVTFTENGVAIGGVAPGTKIAWLGMIRERAGAHARVRFERGFGPATPAGKLEIAEAGADRAHAIWVVADVGSGSARRSAAPGFVHSSAGIVIDATPGGVSVAIESAMVELVYVRPKRGAWSFGTGDGSTLDADGESNGVVVMPLSALNRFQGNPHPPEQVEEGDVILVIDPYRIRSGQLAVTR